ncbi:unnamed protein product [Amoebophrya sp. A25]|nr:unnamed protein product [Amoebophrya sp. A25]|eukprot:GSA25T00006941001.1
MVVLQSTTRPLQLTSGHPLKTKPIYVSRRDDLLAKGVNERLMDAAEVGNYRAVGQCLQEGADVNFVNHKGSCPLAEAVVSGNCPSVGLLLRADADPNIANAWERRTPLHRACFHKFRDIASLLLLYGANPFSKDSDGSQPGDLGLTTFLEQHITGEECLYEDEHGQDAVEADADVMVVEGGNEQPAASEERLLPAENAEAGKEDAKTKKSTSSSTGKAGRQVSEENKTKLAEFRANWARTREDNAAKAAEAQAAKTKADEEARALAEKEKAERAAWQEKIAAEKAAKEAEQRAKAEERERDRKAELEAMRLAAHEADPEGAAAEEQMRLEMERRQQICVKVGNSGESSVNGVYQCVFFDTYRVEYRGVENKNCNLFWSSIANEWRLCVNGYKAGNTLYRNPKVTKTKEVPLIGWLPWFGKTPCPSLETAELTALQKEDSSTTSSSTTSEQPQAETSSSVDNDKYKEASALASGKEVSKKISSSDHAGTSRKEFLECRSILDICASTEVDALTAETAGGKINVVTDVTDIVLKKQLERLLAFEQAPIDIGDHVEELLGAEDGVEQEEDGNASTSTSATTAWAKIEECKQEGNAAYGAGKIQTALAAFSRALEAVGRVAEGIEGTKYATDKRSKAVMMRVSGMLSVLHSNRSLVLLKVISEKLYDDAAIVDVLYEQVKSDSTKALQAEGGKVGTSSSSTKTTSKMKMFYRRALACRGLGQLEQALEDITRVVEYYEVDCGSTNAEAVQLREAILEEVKAEDRKWGTSKAKNRYNAVASTRDRSRREPGRVEGSAKPEKMVVMSSSSSKTGAKEEKWTRSLVEKRLHRPPLPGQSAAFFASFCPAGEFEKLYGGGAKLPVEAFGTLVCALLDATSCPDMLSMKEDCKKYLTVAEKSVSEVDLAMLSDKEMNNLEKLKKSLGL